MNRVWMLAAAVPALSACTLVFPNFDTKGGSGGAGGTSGTTSTASNGGAGGTGVTSTSSITSSATAPSASIPSGAVDFGMVGCGATAASQMLPITNSGGGTLTYTASLSVSPVFSIASGASGQVAGGEAGTVTIAATVPTNSVAGATFSATLTITTNDPAHASTTLQVTLTPQGGALTLAPTIASFGLVPVGSAPGPVPLTLTNTGNDAVTLSFGAPSDTQFGITYAGSPNAVTLMPNTALQGLAATYAPTNANAVVTSAAIDVTGAICGVSATSIPLSGQGTNGAFGASTTDVYFGPNGDGNVPCGTLATAKTFTISNAGNSPFTWNATLGQGASSSFSVNPLSGTVSAEVGSTPGTATITVTPVNAIPATSATTTDLYADTLTITTGIVGDTVHVINLHETAYGAILGFSPTSYAFGEVPVSTTTNTSIAIQNSGNGPANVTLAETDGPVFTVSPTTSSLVSGGSSFTATVSYTPADITSQSGSLSMTTAPTDILCAPLPAAATVTGTGENGVVAYSPASINFGTTDCGATAKAQSITFTNAGNTGYAITPSLALGASSPYTITMSPTTGLVASGGSCIVTVTPKAIPSTSAVTPDLYGDLLTVTTDATGDSAHYIALSQTAGGAILAFEGASVDFGGVFGGWEVQKQFGMTNTGNEMSGNLTFSLQNGTTQFNLQQPPGVPSHATQRAVMNFVPTPNMAQGYSDIAVIAVQQLPGRVLCQPLPFTQIALSATGILPNITVNQSKGIEFNLVPCGEAAPAQTFVLANKTAAAFQVTSLTLGKTGANAIFTVSPGAPLTVAASTEQTFTVTPVAIPATASTQYHFYNDVLTITTNAPGATPLKVFLEETAQGAVLSYSESTVAFPTLAHGTQTTANGAFYVVNNGNLGISGLGFSLSDTTDFSIAPTSFSVSNNGNNFAAMSGTFSPAAAGSLSSTTTLMGPATGLCAPLPTGLTLTGTAN